MKGNERLAWAQELKVGGDKFPPLLSFGVMEKISFYMILSTAETNKLGHLPNADNGICLHKCGVSSRILQQPCEDVTFFSQDSCPQIVSPTLSMLRQFPELAT